MDANIDYDTVTLERIEAHLKNEVYKAALILERLEGSRRVRGSGHHMAQKIADEAAKLLRDRWVG